MMYDIIYSKRRTLALSVVDGKLIVRAPNRTSKIKIEKAIEEHSAWIEKHIKASKKRMEDHPEPTAEEEIELRRKARDILPLKTAYYAKIMGLNYGRITITGAKTRFGSCSLKGNISYSYRLMLYPEEAIDYVVVHELAHLLEMNHSQRFYAIIERVLPDYKERKKLLKE